jgi:hypothetical protein
MTSKKLTRRQARWALTLANYNFQITFRPGIKNGKADALTRKPGDRPLDDTDERQKHQVQTLIPAQKLSPELRQALEATLSPINASNPVLAEAGPEPGDSEEDPEMPESIEDRIRAAQLDDATCKRVIEKINKGERKDHEVTLAHATIENGSLFLDAKL